MLYDKNGRYRTAVDLCERARMGFEDLLGFEHPYTLLSIVCLSTLLVQLVGQAEDAMVLANKALEGYMKIRSFSSFSTMMAATIVAFVAVNLGRYKDADDLTEKGHQLVHVHRRGLDCHLRHLLRFGMPSKLGFDRRPRIRGAT